MPTLHWIGKDAVVNHHKSVPFRLLHECPELSAGASDMGNLLVEGDNLLALKALLPRYGGQVKCIYIDPPYNTGNEGWIYNDAVNAPEMQKWLHHAVGREAEDLSRHDKWLCMMYPRLQLLRQFLRDDGAIFISIDDNEVANLRLIMDEIFGNHNALGTLVWKRRSSSAMRGTPLSIDHEYIIAYSKDVMRVTLHGLEKGIESYPLQDEKGNYASTDLTVGMGNDVRPGQFYTITNPTTGRVYPANPARVWRFSPETMKQVIEADLVIWPDATEGRMERPRYKTYFDPLSAKPKPVSSWIEASTVHNREIKDAQEEYDVAILKSGMNEEGGRQLVQILGSKQFAYPKPLSLIQAIVKAATRDTDIVLDSFAGSGTTGHAVMQLNREDGGNRRFLLVEMEPHIARTVTAARLRRVLENGQGEEEKRRQREEERGKASLFPAGMAVEDEAVADNGTGAPEAEANFEAEIVSPSPLPLFSSSPPPGFRYCTLGEPLFTSDENVSADVTVDELARYVFYTATGATLPERSECALPLLEIANGTAVYLLWNGQSADTLNLTRLRGLPPHDGPRIIYGAACRLSRARLQQEGITFRQFPYQLETE